MNALGRKIASMSIFTGLAVAIGAFCFAAAAGADTTAASRSGKFPVTHCADKASTSVEQPFSAPGASVLPCCLDHSGQVPATIGGQAVGENIKFFAVGAAQDAAQQASFLVNHAYVCAKSPPVEPDILSSVLKKE